MKGYDLMDINYEVNDFSFVGNSEQTLVYELYDSNSLPLSGIIIKKILWRLARYGESYPVLEKSMIVNDGGQTIYNGIKFENNLVTVDIHHSDTTDLSGKFTYQLTNVDAGDNYFIPSEGLGLIRKYITA
jgi:hypothetical protein